MAKLDAQKDVPIVRILDEPTLPVQKSSPKRALFVVMMGLVTLFGALFAVITTEAIRRVSTGSERQSYETLKADFTREFPRISQVLSRRTEEVEV